MFLVKKKPGFFSVSSGGKKWGFFFKKFGWGVFWYKKGVFLVENGGFLVHRGGFFGTYHTLKSGPFDRPPRVW